LPIDFEGRRHFRSSVRAPILVDAAAQSAPIGERCAMPATARPSTTISLLAALLLAGSPVGGTANAAATCAPASEQAVARLFERWNAALATGEPAKVAALYAENAVLMPALSERVYVGRAQIRDYYAEFLGLHPQAAVQMRATLLGCNTASDAGAFVYRVTGRRKGTRMLIGGRFSAAYEFRDGDWRIVHHHISGMYRPLSAVGGLAPKGRQ
jgi:uncharacterized protein (TIGR02246 family)